MKKFLEYVDIDPRTYLEKGEVYDYVEMKQVEPFTRKPSIVVKKKYIGQGCVFREGDILLARITPSLEHGKVIFVKKLDTKVGFGSTEFFVLRTKNKKIGQLYLYYFCFGPIFRETLINSMVGASGRQRVNKGVFYDYEFDPPPLPIQRKIASILSAYDDLIELNERRIKILEEMARLIYKEWFVKFKFPGYEKVKMVESELGMIPEGWEVRSILDIEGVNLIKAKVKRYNGVKEYFATANIEGNNIIKNGEMVTYDERPSRAQMQPEENTIWFAKMRETYKVLCFTSANKEKAERSILSSGFAGLKADKDIFGFAYFTVNSKEFHNQKDQFCTGATQMSSTIEGLSLIKIVLPDKNLVKEYSELTQPIIDQIIRLQQQNSILRQTRDMLLPKLISGEIDV